ncbi:hypothetical protein niasHS_004236 [Heterodera schachtii]|uniref:Secreted protein n=1 Tax=Heterodera schachtii TaxID=97005 RepID=A0ABD2JN84_HETSC
MCQPTKLFISLFIFSAFLLAENLADGLKCKQGFEIRPLVEQQLEPEECVDIEHARFCEASICTTDNVPNFAGIHWKCAEEQNAKECAERIKEIYEKKGELKNVSCQCHYGEEGEDFGNKKFTLQPPADPTDKGDVFDHNNDDDNHNHNDSNAGSQRG